MSTELIDLVLRLGQPRVLVVGDLMLDRYVWGDAERVSQEAPVLLLHADRREERLGGAASVASMLRALGARVSVAGVVGPDAGGERVRRLLPDLVSGAGALGLRTRADPPRGGDYRKYHGCSAVTPNRLEAGLATGRTLASTADALAAAGELRERLDLEAAVVTLDREGMAL